MDPNQALGNIRSALYEFYQTAEEFDADALTVIKDNVEALDEWLSRGGFLPSAWQR
jgi:hypothetical protein